MATIPFPTVCLKRGSLDVTTETNLRRAEFGDNYTQESVEGINATRQEFDAVFVAQSATDAETLRLTLVNSRAQDVFEYQIDGQAVPLFFVVDGRVQATRVGFDAVEISCKFRQVYR